VASWIARAAALRALGWHSLLRVGWYRALLKLERHPAQRLKLQLPSGPFFFRNASLGSAPAAAPTAWRKDLVAFGWHRFAHNGEPPQWRRNLFSGFDYPAVPWWRLPDFLSQAGDIKGVWELSRFDWVLAFAQQARAGDELALGRLNEWLADWCRANPAFLGPNWKCGQEASIRVLRLALAADVLGETQTPTDDLSELIVAHLRRIAPTISYALGQDNNHGTSEAAALFVGGSWLDELGDQRGEAWANTGRRFLEERARTLIMPDGSFSQYSVTYHRLMLETYTVAEIWRRRRGLAPFSRITLERLNAATRWLAALASPVTGDAPNLGANDGAHLLPLTDAPTRDFRPAVSAAAALFAGADAHADSADARNHLLWLGIQPVGRPLVLMPSDPSPDAGFVRMNHERSLVVLRVPRYRFRPGQADPLHLDLWLDGENILRDGGSFSYADPRRGLTFYPGIASHNSVQFDGREPMPRLGTFLWGQWLSASNVHAPTTDGLMSTAAAAYVDAFGAHHSRSLRLQSLSLEVTDELRGLQRSAVLRWRLLPGLWRLEGNALTNGRIVITVSADVPIHRRELVNSWESRHYMHETILPVLEVEVTQDARLHTVIAWTR
jgi:hypothetical protein